MARCLPRACLIALALTLAPTATATIGSFGTHVTDTDADEVYSLETDILASVVLIDDDGDERPDVDEPILLLKSGTYIHTTAIRLAYPMTSEVGSQVRSGDDDAGRSGTTLAGQFGYLDMDGDQAFTPGDYLFYDLSGGQQGQVSVGDLYLTGPRAGEVVTSASSLVSRSLTAISATWGVDDRDDNGLDQGDRVYIDADGDGRLSVSDVRVGVDTANLFGTWPPVDASRITLPLSTDNTPSSFVSNDADGDGKVDPGEAVFLSRSTSQVFGATVRLHAPISGEVGTLVEGGDDDLGLNVVELSGTLSFDGTGDIGADEPLIFDHDGSGSGTGDANEMILSGQEAGSLIDGASPHQGASLSAAPGTISFLDVDGDGGFGLYDILYLDADDDGFLSSGDVQLSAYTEEVLYMEDPEAGGSAGDDGDDGEAQDPEPAPEPTPDNRSDDESAGPSDSDGDGVEDRQDACPNHAAQTADGCPVDADGDGVPDDQDDCPNVAAVTTDGCPPDAGGDGVADRDDDCPDEVGATANAGCPEPASTDDDNVTDDDQGEDQQGSPGPGAVVVLAALSGMALALARRRPT